MTKKEAKKETQAQQAAEKQAAKDKAVAEAIKETVAGEIWNEIKDKTIEMFALPDQIVSMHAHPVPVEPSKLFLVTNSSAVLPSLEAAVGKKYVVELAGQFITVSRAVQPFKK